MAKAKGSNEPALKKIVFTRTGMPVLFNVDGQSYQVPGGYSTHDAEFVDKALSTPQGHLIGVLSDEEVAVKEKEENEAEQANKDAEVADKKRQDDEMKAAKKALAEANAKEAIRIKEDARKTLTDKIAVTTQMIKDSTAELAELNKQLKAMDGDVKGDK